MYKTIALMLLAALALPVATPAGAAARRNGKLGGRPKKIKEPA